jgi:hypothetical protein
MRSGQGVEAMIPRNLVLAAIAALFATAAHAQTAPAPAPSPAPAPQVALAPTEPIAMFKAVCIGGTARLSRKWAAATTYAALPEGARAVLGQPVMNVPNPVYQINGANQFLIVSAPESKMPFALGCAVIWEGDHLAAANKLVPAPAGSQLVVTASMLNGWTVLKSTPAAPVTPSSAGVR